MRKMNDMMKNFSFIFIASIAIFFTSIAQAQHEGHDMSAMSSSAEPTKTNDDAMAGMDHGEMQMQGGDAPTDARDPNAYAKADGDKRSNTLTKVHSLHLADSHNFYAVIVDKLERSYSNSSNDNNTAYDSKLWFGQAYDRLVIKAEGEVKHDTLEESRTEALWSHAIDTYWDTQLGIRHDQGEEPEQTWLAFGVEGLAPYWFDVDITGYLGENNQSALRLHTEYEILITQRLILQPDIELNIYGKRDESRHVGSGLSEAKAGLRLRYEISRQFAPYIGVERKALYGDSADFARDETNETRETFWVAGVRFWF